MARRSLEAYGLKRRRLNLVLQDFEWAWIDDRAARDHMSVPSVVEQTLAIGIQRRRFPPVEADGATVPARGVANELRETW